MTEGPEKIVPYDPRCQRFAVDMTDYDMWIADEHGIPLKEVTPAMRNQYVEQTEGTYNPDNGHFLCDQCYIEVGMPSSRYGWKCP